MGPKVAAWVEDFGTRVLPPVGRLTAASVGIELQQEGLRSLVPILPELRDMKEAAIEAGSEDDANALLSMEALVTVILKQLEMWVAFKEDRMGAAWDALIDAQDALSAAIRAHPVASERFDAPRIVPALGFLEHVLFPPQVFASPGIVVGAATCSICGADAGACDHRPGHAYLGRFCSLMMGRPVRIDHVVLTDNPTDKHCRVPSISDESGTFDKLTLRITPPDPDSGSEDLTYVKVLSTSRAEAD